MQQDTIMLAGFMAAGISVAALREVSLPLAVAIGLIIAVATLAAWARVARKERVAWEQFRDAIEARAARYRTDDQ